MAIWQVPIEFIPSRWAEENNFNAELLYDEDGYDCTPAWENCQPSKEYKRIFSSILPEADSWDEELELWGESPVHDISVWRENDIIEGMGFRLDLREDIRGLITQFIAAANELNCYLFTPGLKVICKPDFVALFQYIRQSNAAKFVSDPHGYLSEINKKHNK